MSVADSSSTMVLRYWQDHRTIGIILVYASLAALLAIPMVITTVPLGVDDLNHLARIQVLAHIGTDPDLAGLFRVKDETIPYLGIDLLLTPLARYCRSWLSGGFSRSASSGGWWAPSPCCSACSLAYRIRPRGRRLIAYNGLMAWG